MFALLELGFVLAYWRVILAVAAALIVALIVIVLLSKRRARRRAQQIAAQIAQCRYVGNKATMVFHTRDCHVLRGVPSGQRIYFASCNQADACGYKACGVCKPWY